MTTPSPSGAEGLGPEPKPHVDGDWESWGWWHKARADRAEAELERERMCHAACGVIAMSNTPDSLARNREIHPDYFSASVQECIRAAEREIALRADLAASRERERVMREALEEISAGPKVWTHIKHIAKAALAAKGEGA